MLYLYENGDSNQYKNARENRLAYVKSNFSEEYDYFLETLTYLTYKEFIEGSARFVEEQYMVDVANDPYIKYGDRVFYSIDESFYSEGSLKAKILDKYYPEWKDNLDFSENNNFEEILKKGKIL